jgi:hypothetical protein
MAIKLKTDLIESNVTNYAIYNTIITESAFKNTSRFYDHKDKGQVSIGNVDIIGVIHMRSSDIPLDIAGQAQWIGGLTEQDQIVTIVCFRADFDNPEPNEKR